MRGSSVLAYSFRTLLLSRSSANLLTVSCSVLWDSTSCGVLGAARRQFHLFYSWKEICILTSLNCSRWVLKNIVSAFVTVMKHHLFKSFRRQREIWGVLKLPTNPTAGVRLINSEVGWIARRVKCGQVEREIRDPCRTVRALTLDEHKKEVPWTNETLVGPCSLAGRAQKG